jgi:hypothetical protein
VITRRPSVPMVVWKRWKSAGGGNSHQHQLPQSRYLFRNCAFLPISKLLPLRVDVPRTETLKEEVSGPTVNVRVSFLPISFITPLQKRVDLPFRLNTLPMSSLMTLSPTLNNHIRFNTTPLLAHQPTCRNHSHSKSPLLPIPT